MQSRSSAAANAIATRSIWFLSNNQALRRGLASATASRTADPAIHAGDYESDPAAPTGDPQGTENVAKEKPVEVEGEDVEEYEKPPTSSIPSCSKGREPLAPPKPNEVAHPGASCPRLESTEVNLQPSNSPINYIQKRRSHTRAGGGGGGEGTSLEQVSCVGLDGTPLPSDENVDETVIGGGDKDREEVERVEDQREYYKHHKASPLSEIKFADTRKPITRATDGTADAVSEYGADVIGWKPEQLDTAEEALNRAARIWKENAMRGDPDAPHSRVLRALRGESF